MNYSDIYDISENQSENIEPNKPTNWEKLDVFLNKHIEEIQTQRRGYVDKLHNEAVKEFGELIPCRSVFKTFLAFWRNFNNVDKVYMTNKYYKPSPRKPRTTTPP